MKLITDFMILFLMISITSESLIDSFSIDHFLNNLKSNGLFEIILSIKKVYGQDVAIISCEELSENCVGNCKRLVTEYMDLSEIPTSPEPPIPKANPIELNTTDEGSIPLPKEYSNFDKNLKMPTLESILSKKFNSEESILISNKIKKRLKNFSKVL